MVDGWFGFVPLGEVDVGFVLPVVEVLLDERLLVGDVVVGEMAVDVAEDAVDVTEVDDGDDLVETGDVDGADSAVTEPCCEGDAVPVVCAEASVAESVDDALEFADVEGCAEAGCVAVGVGCGDVVCESGLCPGVV